jgi:hypothetical protein
MKVEVKITDDAGNIRQYVVSGSLHLVDFIEEIEYMQGYNGRSRFLCIAMAMGYDNYEGDNKSYIKRK